MLSIPPQQAAGGYPKSSVLDQRGGYLVTKLHITLVKGSNDGLDQLGYQDTTGWGSQPGILKLPSQQVADRAPGKFGIIG